MYIIDGKSDSRLMKNFLPAALAKPPASGARRMASSLARGLSKLRRVGYKLGLGRNSFSRIIIGQAVDRSIAEGIWTGSKHPENIDRMVAAAKGEAVELWFSNDDMNAHLSRIGAQGMGQTMIMGTTGIGKSMSMWGMIRMLMVEESPSPMCHAAKASGWEIAVDEALDASHPAVALAWLSRARVAERSMVGSGLGLAESFALSLARSMSGRSTHDDLHPDFAAGCLESQWARLYIPNILEKAGELSIVLSEASEISKACSSVPALASNKRVASL